MPTTLQASVTDLANQVARLAQRIDHLLAIAETPRQQCVESKQQALAPTAAEHIVKTNEVDSEECSLLPPGEETRSQQTRTMPVENAVATSLADLHERLGGFLETSSHQRSDAPKVEVVRDTRTS